MKTFWKIFPWLIIAVLLYLKFTAEPKVVTEYVKGETVTDTIRILNPVKVEVPSEPKYITTTDTIRITKTDTVTITKIDTAAIVKDWIKKRTYKRTLFDNDTTGTLKIGAVVQYNKLHRLSYEFEPIIRVKKIKPTKLRFGLGVFAGYGISEQGLSPMVGVGLSYDLIRF